MAHTAHWQTEFGRGWKTILASSLGVAIGLGGLPFFTLGVFLKPLVEEFGWSRAEVSAASLCLSFGSGLTAPFIGRIADRIDIRKLVLTSMLAMLLGYLALTQMTGNVYSLYLGLFVVALGGCGTSPLVWILTINTWFDRSRGLAIGLTLAGSGIAAIFAPRAIDVLIRWHGWQAGYIGMAAFTGFVAFPLILLLFPGKNPEAMPRQNAASLPGLTARQAFASIRFWQLSVGILLVAGAVGAMLIHLIPLMTDAGLPRDRATEIGGLLGLAVVVGRISTGYLIDRFHAPTVALAVLSIPALAFVLLAAYPGAPLVLLAGTVMFGLAAGAEVDLLAFLASRFFGLRAFGQIYGLLLIPFLLGGGVGPILLGRVHDVTGSYQLGLYACAAICLAGAVLMGSLGRYTAFGPRAAR